MKTKTIIDQMNAERPDDVLADLERKHGNDGQNYRLNIEAVGMSRADAVAYALRLIGMMIQQAHTRGHSCGGETGNASGNWDGPNDRAAQQ